MARPDHNVRTPVLTRFRTAMLMAPFLGVSAAALAYGERAAGIFAAGVTLTLWAAILKFFGGDTAPPPPSTPRPQVPVFVGPEPSPPLSHRVERIVRVAADPRAPEGERAAAREALRRLGYP